MKSNMADDIPNPYNIKRIIIKNYVHKTTRFQMFTLYI